MKPSTALHALQAAARGWRVGVCAVGGGASVGVFGLSILSAGMPYATRAHAKGKLVNRSFIAKP